MKKFTLFAVLAGFSFHAFSQGTAFTYQGRLTAGASPANGSYDLTFALFNVDSGPGQVGSTLTNTATAVSNGLFTVTLDFGDQFPGADRWLEIGVRTNGGGVFATLSPRQQLTSTPYAIQSANASAADSVAAGNITGTLNTSQLPSAVITNGASGVTISGNFSGDGNGLTGVPGTLPWNVVAGTNLVAAPNQGYLLTNSVTVTLPHSANIGDVISISAPGSNSWQVSQRYVPSVNAPWTAQSDFSYQWRSLASSADGTKLAAVGGNTLYLSSDLGVTWTPQNAYTPFWMCVASSADGARLVGGTCNGMLYTSSDSGLTWTAQSNGIPNGGNQCWASVASSADGTKLAAASYPGLIYTSTNSGASWTAQTNGLLNGGTNYWVSIASSADGTTLIVAPGRFPPVPQGPVYISTNSGATWISQGPLMPNNQVWSSVACSADGTRLAAVSRDGSSPTTVLCMSTNSGVAWAKFFESGDFNWSQVTMSADGKTILASALNSPTIINTPGILEVSTNSGQTWTTLGPFNGGVPFTNWTAVACSADGAQMIAASSPGHIYISGGEPVYVAGAPGVTTEFQYLGNNVWQPMGQSASQIVGTLPTANLPASVLTNGQSGVALSGSLAGVLSGSFTGDGGALTNLNASQLTGTVPDGRLSSNVALRSGGNTFGGDQAITNGSFTGNGSALTNLNASQLTGTVPDGRLSSNVALRSVGNAFSGNQTVTSGNLGVGQSTPNFPLSFADALGDKINLWGNSGNGGNHYGLGIQASQFQIHTVSSADDVVFGYGQSSNLTETMRIKGNGNVGIGNNNPQSKLDVIGNGRTILVRPTLAAQSSFLEFDDPSLTFRGMMGLDGNGFSGTPNQFSIGTWTSHPIGLFTGTTERMTIGTNGNVGIGTSNPGNNLQVGSQFFSAAGYGLQVNSPAFGADIQINSTGGLGLFLHNAAGGNANMLRINNGPSNTNVFNVTGNGTVFAAGTVTAVSFNPTSDRNAKENFQPVSGADVLAKVVSMPVQEWNFKADAGVRHIGPMAQDFHAAFGLGTDDRHIATVDADGVALAAIQGLNQKLEETLTELKRRDAENAELRARLERLEQWFNEKTIGAR